MQQFQYRDQYGPWLAEFLAVDHLPDLGPGRPWLRDIQQLAAANDNDLFGDRPVVDSDMANCCRAGLWLWCDELDRSHEISQQITTPSGSYWHAIMHRREPDFANAKYWVQRVGEHPVYKRLAAAVRELADSGGDAHLAPVLTPGGRWDPNSLVDLCRRYSGSASNQEQVCRLVAWREWQLLFDHCYRIAIGR